MIDDNVDEKEYASRTFDGDNFSCLVSSAANKKKVIYQRKKIATIKKRESKRANACDCPSNIGQLMHVKLRWKIKETSEKGTSEGSHLFQLLHKLVEESRNSSLLLGFLVFSSIG